MSLYVILVVGPLWVITLFHHFGAVLSHLQFLHTAIRSFSVLFVELLHCIWFYLCAGCFYELFVYLYNLKYEAPEKRTKLRLEEDFESHLRESWIPFRSLSVDDTLTEQWRSSSAVQNELSSFVMDSVI